MMLRTIIIALLLMADHGWATTYYVSTSGSDANNGLTNATAWRNPQKCGAAGSPLVAGDVCLVSAGTYTDPDTDGITVLISGSSSPAGTITAPITIKSEVPGAAVIQIPVTTLTGKRGFSIQRPYWIVDGFQITGGGGNTGAIDMSMTGILLGAGATGTVIRRNDLHDIGRNLCSDSASSFAGMSVQGPDSVLVEYNRFYKIGRLRNGESGCTTARYQHDHGMYIQNSTNLTVRRNIFIDVTRGYAFQLFKSGGSTNTNFLFVHNAVMGGASLASPKPAGHIALCYTLNNVQIKNNVFYDPPFGYAVQTCSAGSTTSSTVIDHNLSNSTVSNWVNPSPSNTYIYTNNLFNTNPGFVSTTVGAEDLSLASGSASINAGVNLGEPFCGTLPDLGPYETCPALSATMNGATMEVTMASVFPPLQPSASGVSLTCSGAGCGSAAVGSITLKSGTSAVASINVTGLPGGVCSAGDTYAVSCSTCGWKDSINVGGTSTQKTLSFTSFPVTNACSGTPPSGPASPIAFYKLEGNVTDSSGNGNHGTQNGGSFVTAKYGQGFQTTNGVSQSFTAGYGNGINIGTQSVTIEMPVFVNASDVNLTRNYMGTIEGTSQRLYILSVAGTWRVVVQSDGASATASDLSVTSGWNHLVLTLDASTNTATLCKNGVTGTTGGAVKIYTDHALPSNINVGNPSGFSTTNAPTAIYDEVKIWNSVQSCASMWAAWDPTSVQAGVHELKAIRFQAVYLDSNGNPVNYGTGNNQAQPVVQDGGVAVVAQIDCQNTAPCTGASYQWRYSFDGVNFNAVVPDTPNSDGVYMWGDSAEVQLNRFAAACPLVGALGCTAGETLLLSHATTAKDVAQNSSYTIRALVRIANPPSSVVYLKPFHENGNALAGGSTPTNGAQIQVIAPQGDAF